MKVSDLIVKCLEAEGVEYVFGLPGEENEDILFSLEKSKQITFISTRHEQGAAFMADVYGRLTGKAGVCLSTLGPGATNLLTGVADAHLDKSPVVAITGQGDSHRLHKESHQFIDVVNMFKPIVKWNTTINKKHIVPEVIRKAFKLSQIEKPGATHFELPEDIAKKEVNAQPLDIQKVRRPSPDYKAINQVIDLLEQSERPLIIAGNGSVRKLASKHLREFVGRTHIPVVSTFMGKGAISYKDKHCLGAIGLQNRDYVMDAIDKSDLILCIGYDIAEVDPERWNPKKKKRIINIDFLPAEVYEYYPVEIEVVCDISGALWEINQILEKDKKTFSTKWFEPIRKKIYDDIESYSDIKLTVPSALNILRKVMRDDDILISDVGAHKLWIGRNFHTCEPNSCIISNGFASMGFALPGGIAAKLAFPKKRVVAAMGDGGFMMNSQEIETAKRIGIGYTILIFNDDDYGLISWKQKKNTGRSFGTKISNPDFKIYADSFGIRSFSPQNIKEVERDLYEAINSGELCLVEIKIDPSVNLELTQKLGGMKNEIS